MTHRSSWSGNTVNKTLHLSLSTLYISLSIVCLSPISNSLFSCESYWYMYISALLKIALYALLYLTSPMFLYIDISVYRHKNLFPVDVDISGLHCSSYGWGGLGQLWDYYSVLNVLVYLGKVSLVIGVHVQISNENDICTCNINMMSHRGHLSDYYNWI